jgi:8-hydroxy-5-deazaflavin:NADPH oxidoreductase
MKIAILGAGNVGSTLGKGWANADHQIVFGVRHPQAEKVQALLAQMDNQASAATVPNAVKDADVVVLATPWQAAQAVLESAGDLTGKVLLDVTNPLTEDSSALTMGYTTSGAEQVAAWAPGSRVYKVFNQTGWETMANPAFENGKAVMFVAGDDPEGKAIALQLATEMGFEAIDVGSLTETRLLEPLAMLWIKLAYMYGQGRDVAFALLRR